MEGDRRDFDDAARSHPRAFEDDEIAEEFSWIEMLSPRSTRCFYGEVYAAATSGMSGAELDQLLGEWKATAELEASPKIMEQIERNRGRRFLTEEEWRAVQRRTA